MLPYSGKLQYFMLSREGNMERAIGWNETPEGYVTCRIYHMDRKCDRGDLSRLPSITFTQLVRLIAFASQRADDLTLCVVDHREKRGFLPVDVRVFNS